MTTSETPTVPAGRRLAWHFLRLVDDVPTLARGLGPAPAVGEWIVHEGAVTICRSGLHASTRAIDALDFVSWKNAAACLVECEDIVTEHAEKFVCRRRRIVGVVTCDELLRLFARECALSVAQFWTMPPVVREYLETGSEDLRAAAWAAARAAAWAAAGDAAGDAPRDAARAAARDRQNALLESLLLAGMNCEEAL